MCGGCVGIPAVVVIAAAAVDHGGYGTDRQ